MKIVGKSPKTKKYYLLVNEEQLQDLENHVNKFQKNAFAKSINSPVDIVRKSMLVDYNLMPKF
jgi:hypothetical protein